MTERVPDRIYLHRDDVTGGTSWHDGRLTAKDVEYVRVPLWHAVPALPACDDKEIVVRFRHGGIMRWGRLFPTSLERDFEVFDITHWAYLSDIFPTMKRGDTWMRKEEGGEA